MINQLGGSRLCMPTVVSFLLSNAYKTKDNGALGEGQLFNTSTNVREEPDAEEKEQLLGYTLGDTSTPGVSDEDRSIRLGELWMATPCVGWVQSCMPAKHRIPTPPRSLPTHFHPRGGGISIQPSLPSTTSLKSGKWSLQTQPFSKHQVEFNARQQRL